MIALERRLAKLEVKAEVGKSFCDMLLDCFHKCGTEMTLRWLQEKNHLQSSLFIVAIDNVHDLERFRGLVPDESIRDAYRSRINRFGDPELQKLIRERAGP